MRFAVLLSAFVLVGCVTMNGAGLEALNRGDLDSAEKLFLQAAQRGDAVAWNNLGVVYQRRGDLKTAINYYRVAARFGDPTAVSNLIQLGEPVPTPDLAALRSQQRANEAAALEAASRFFLRPPPPLPSAPSSIFCTSHRAGNVVNTNCN